MAYFQTVPGQVISSAHMNSAIAQGCPPFGSAAERDAAIPAPFEGQACFRTDLNRRELFSGTAWRVESGLLTSQGNNRHSFAVYTGAVTTDANGDTQVLNLSQGGQFDTGAGSLYWASCVRFGGIGYQLAPLNNDAGAAKFRLWNQAGSLVTSQTPTGLYICYLARLAY